MDEQQRPYELREHGGGLRLFTREDYYPYLLRLRSLKKVEKLTPAALETLAIIAYRQPVIRAEIEAIRGVRTGPLLRALLDRKLIQVVGRAEVPGAPLQYGTTPRFLDRFGLKDIADLPSLKEFRQGRI
ncbi:MAG: SMC-Scp complex subunit ScpB [Planctomycetes bacterium]|nr:SMC-Scp complex subunit ScpB [Planctomycetota bacterium]